MAKHDPDDFFGAVDESYWTPSFRGPPSADHIKPGNWGIYPREGGYHVAYHSPEVGIVTLAVAKHYEQAYPIYQRCVRERITMPPNPAVDLFHLPALGIEIGGRPMSVGTVWARNRGEFVRGDTIRVGDHAITYDPTTGWSCTCGSVVPCRHVQASGVLTRQW